MESDFSVAILEALKKVSNTFKILREKNPLIIYSTKVYQSCVGAA